MHAGNSQYAADKQPNVHCWCFLIPFLRTLSLAHLSALTLVPPLLSFSGSAWVRWLLHSFDSLVHWFVLCGYIA